MIILKSLQLNNYLSHEETKISFNPTEKLLIDGPSGSGKSSIVESIIWALYGKGRSDNNRGLIKSGKGYARVILNLQDEKNYYRIERGITRAGKNSLKVSSGATQRAIKPIKVTGFKALQSFIEIDLLHSSYLLFINSIAYPQDNVENFVKQSASKRKDIILEIVNASVYDDYYVKTRTALSEIEKEVIKLESVIETLSSSTQEDQDKIASIPTLKSEAKRLEKDIAEKKVKLDFMVEEISSINAREATNDVVLKTITGFENKKAELEAKVKGLHFRYEEFSQRDPSIAKRIEIELENAVQIYNDKSKVMQEIANWDHQMLEFSKSRPAQRAFDNEIAELNKQMIAIGNKPIEDCPELNKPCPIIKKEQNARIEELGERLDKVTAEKNDYVVLLNAHLAKELALGKRPVYRTCETPLAEMKTMVDSLQSQLNEIRFNDSNSMAELGRINEAIQRDNNEIESLKKNIEESRSKYTVIEEPSSNLREKFLDEEKLLRDMNERLRIIENDLAVANNMKQTADKNATTVKESKKALKSKKETASALSLLKTAFSPNGIKSIVIDYVIPRLEDRINDILHLLSEFTIRLDTQRKGVKEDVVKEGLFISIFNELGEEFDFDNYSGGERLKIIVAISEALSELQNVGFRILDELFVGLDEESTEKFSDVMNALHGRFDQMLCISHLRNIKDLFDNKLIVSKQNGTSQI